MTRAVEYKLCVDAAAGLQTQGDGDGADSVTRYILVIGADEAGRGPLAGPVIAAACCMPLSMAALSRSCTNHALIGPLAALGDSKKLSESARNAIDAELRRQQQQAQAVATTADGGAAAFTDPAAPRPVVIAFRTCRVEAREIDELNILEASLHAMERAVDGVLEDVAALGRRGRLPPLVGGGTQPTRANCVVLVDGPHVPRHLERVPPPVAAAAAAKSAATQAKKPLKPKALTPKAVREAVARDRITRPLSSVNFAPAAVAVIRGDALCPSIAAASVLAKVERDRIVDAEIAPHVDKAYNLAQNKGYPTAEHLAALARLGPTRFHRVSYGPVREAVEKRAAAAARAQKKKARSAAAPTPKVATARASAKSKKGKK